LHLPSISIIIPTYNSEKVLPLCLKSIENQDYPKHKLEIIVVDGGSSDRTVDIARKFGVDKMLKNPLRTGEAGKAVGVEAAENEIIAFIDSDNVLDGKDWLKRMVRPFQDSEIVGSEPVYYGYSSKDPIIIRYCSLIGADDPLTIYLGFYGRHSFLRERWTDIALEISDEGSYYKITLNPGVIPTMGANGFLVRACVLKKTNYEPFLFDVDTIYELIELGYNKFARVKTGIFHLYALTSTQYIRKTYRRIRDYYKYHGVRRYPWTKFNKSKLLKFLLGVLTLIPLFRDSVKGYRRKPDVAWFLHWFLCLLTVLVYAIKEVSSGFYLLRRA
jgi:glycosyltransferase involved in cell wall biosynthesis